MQAPVVGPRPARLPRTLLLGVTAATVARSLASPLGAPQGPACPWRPRAGSHERRPGRPEPARPRASPISSAARRFLIPTETFQQQEVEALRSERPVARSSEVCAVPRGFHLFHLIKWLRESTACVSSPAPPAGLGHAAHAASTPHLGPGRSSRLFRGSRRPGRWPREPVGSPGFRWPRARDGSCLWVGRISRSAAPARLLRAAARAASTFLRLSDARRPGARLVSGPLPPTGAQVVDVFRPPRMTLRWTGTRRWFLQDSDLFPWDVSLEVGLLDRVGPASIFSVLSSLCAGSHGGRIDFQAPSVHGAPLPAPPWSPRARPSYPARGDASPQPGGRLPGVRGAGRLPRTCQPLAPSSGRSLATLCPLLTSLFCYRAVRVPHTRC